MKAYGRGPGSKRTEKGRGNFKTEEKAGRAGAFGGIVGAAASAAIAAVGSAVGYQAAGPAGAVFGLSAGVAAEGVKHYATAGISAVMSRRGGSGGGDGSVEGLRAAVHRVADELASSTTSAVYQGIQAIEESLNRINAIASDSSSSLVDEARGHLEMAKLSCEEANGLYSAAGESARTWASGL